MQYAGICLMALSVVCGGFYGARVLKEQLEILLLFRQMVYHLKGRILHGNDALPEAFREVGERFAEQNGNLGEPGRLFLRIAGRMEQERKVTFAQLWKEEAEDTLSRLPIAKVDRRNLLELGEQLGYADRDMQERTMLFYLERTDDSIAAMKVEMDTKVKLYRYLGVAAGAFLIVLLV